jgi:DNA-damage-inducible protein J
MPKSATISMRIDGQLKNDAEAVFKQLGLSTSEAIKGFFNVVRNRKGLPFVLQSSAELADIASNAQRLALLDSVMGKYASIPTSSEEFNIRKHQELDAELSKHKQ